MRHESVYAFLVNLCEINNDFANDMPHCDSADSVSLLN